ncbi:helicase HerA domain-containing protein [Catenuloplanes atrovinosus]|uniref:AAA+ ATPase domain-containing protein n=1 Tax=Catenuloplanes atrovinosus TaxID=137266 RepID=A0AAE3YU36_9ACTN|nr:DUF87 domain-containing protein [Catenuloplanes atrovinosus]MDR7278424.1 hypothetical protein [Catenuloplanes atrovinosus]
MREDERRALDAISFNWAPTSSRVWQPPEAHVTGLNEDVYRIIRAAVREAAADDDESPLGIVVEGQPGSGKTHLLSWTREYVQGQGGYFLLAGLTRGREFWPDIVHTFVEDLRRPGRTGTQLQLLLTRLADLAKVDQETRDRVAGTIALTPSALIGFERAVRRLVPGSGQMFGTTLRAVTMLAADDPRITDIGEAYLESRLDDATEDWARWGLPVASAEPRETAESMSRILALTGPIALAFDQIDTIFAQSRTSHDDDIVLAPLADQLGSGLMEIRQSLRRTVLLVACLRRSWDLIRDHAVGSVPDRFRRETQLHRLPSAELARRLVARRLAATFEHLGFTPPYPTWPVPKDAFSHARDFTPRMLLQRVDWHIRSCLRADEIRPLADLRDATEDAQTEPPRTSDTELIALDERLATLVAEASVDAALSPETEDAAMPSLLTAGLRAWVIETGAANEYEVQAGSGATPVFHAMLRHFLDPDTDDQEHWSIRCIAKEHHRSVIARIERLKRAAALDSHVAKRAAVILRPAGTHWSSGPATTQTWQGFEAAGGRIITPSPDDLKVFAALRVLLEQPSKMLTAWLMARRPAGGTVLMGQILGEMAVNRNAASSTHDGPDPPLGEPVIDGRTVALGIAEDGTPVTMRIESLRKHVAIFAGSGSGKTVLIRRLIEECALRGVSSIVLDPNNDLARLGDPWPEPPTRWGPGDAALAAAYLKQTEVIVWTPRRQAGRPLTLQPLPDLTTVLDDPDDLAIGLDIAVAALAPRARLSGNTARTDRGRAILRKALAYFAHRGGGSLAEFIALLADLPEDVASLERSVDIASDMAQTLTAACINDPLFGGAGTPLVPGALLAPSPGVRARISVISLIGLSSEEQRQSFVNQLQMGLMTWIKAHPASGHLLSGLLVMDEAQTIAPSGLTTAATESTLALASQARKYGLGLIFATQAPRGIHNQIVGNAATQFYGLIKAPAQIAAVRQLLQGRFSEPIDVSGLKPGSFYLSDESGGFSKISVPMSLSHHPPSALSAEEVLARARR